MDQNPYQSPEAFSGLQELFDPSSVPLEFTPSVNWTLYWSSMLVADSVIIGCVVYMLILSSSWIVMAVFGVVVLTVLFGVSTGVRGLMSKIVIARNGIQPSRFSQLIEWRKILSWSQDSNSMITLCLTDGRRIKIVGCATSADRNRIIADALAHFGVLKDEKVGE